MAFKDLLVHVDSGARAPERLDLAFAVARRLGGRVTGMFAELDTLGPSLVGRRTREDMDRAAEAGRRALEAAAGRAGTAAAWWRLEPGDARHVEDLATVCCRYVDLAIFGQHDPKLGLVPEDLVEQVVLGCGRPVLVVPAFGHWADAGDRVVIAWDGSREAARAVHDALPLLRGARAVTLMAFQLPATGAPPALPDLDVAAHLKAHGVAARYERVIVDDLGVSDLLLNRCSDEQADLIVMGARARAGLPPRRAETFHAILGSMTAPVLLSC
jgi:nucleotide-binding universal stress UspA family protein